MTPVIELQKISVQYTLPNGKVFQALDQINLVVNAGDFVSIMGPSGSGKTTLANIIGCMSKATSGRYVFDGKSTRRFNDNQFTDLRASSIGFIFQDYVLIEHLTVIENVALPLIYTTNVSRRQALKLAKEKLASLGLAEKLNHLPSQLSGGQKQRVAIARALMKKPKLLLADEPAGALDDESRVEVLSTLQRLNDEGATIVLVTHSVSDARAGNRLVRIENGRIAEDRVQTAKIKFFGKDQFAPNALDLQSALGNFLINKGLATPKEFLHVLDLPIDPAAFIRCLDSIRVEWPEAGVLLDAAYDKVAHFGELECAAFCATFLRLNGRLLGKARLDSQKFATLYQPNWSEETLKIYLAGAAAATTETINAFVPVQVLLEHSSPTVRAAAASLLGNKEVRNHFLNPTLARNILCDEDGHVRAVGLKAMSESFSMSHLREYAFENDPESEVRATWALVLNRSGELDDSLKILWQMMNSEKPEEFRAAAVILNEINSLHFLQYFEQLIKANPHKAHLLNNLDQIAEKSRDVSP